MKTFNMREGLIYAAVSTYLIAASGMVAAHATENTSDSSEAHSVQHHHTTDPAQELGPLQEDSSAKESELGSSGSPFSPEAQSRLDARYFYNIHEVPGYEEFEPVPVWVGDVGYDCDPALDCSLGPNIMPIGIIDFRQHRR